MVIAGIEVSNCGYKGGAQANYGYEERAQAFYRDYRWYLGFLMWGLNVVIERIH